MSRVVVVANNEMPTENAHGVQLAKSAEAFAATGADVELWYHRPPRRAGTPGDVFEFYEVKPTFEVRKLGDINVMRLEAALGRAFPYLYAARSSLWAVLAAMRARRSRADLYFTRDVDVAYWFTRLGLPTLWEAHRVPKRLGRSYVRSMGRRDALRGVAALTSIAAREIADLGVDPEIIVVVGGGVDLGVYEHLPSQAECRERLSLPLDRPIIGYVGRFLTLNEEKGIPELVRAMAHLPASCGHEPLLACVGGPMGVVDNYRRLAAEAGTPDDRLLFFDRVPSSEVPIWLGAMDVGAMPFPPLEHYVRYMSPMKLFEYMAAGLPILSTDLPAVRDVLRHDDNAWLIPPDDEPALVAALTTLLREPALRARLADQAKRDVVASDWTTRARRLLEHAL